MLYYPACKMDLKLNFRNKFVQENKRKIQLVFKILLFATSLDAMKNCACDRSHCLHALPDSYLYWLI